MNPQERFPYLLRVATSVQPEKVTVAAQRVNGQVIYLPETPRSGDYINVAGYASMVQVNRVIFDTQACTVLEIV